MSHRPFRAGLERLESRRVLSFGAAHPLTLHREALTDAIAAWERDRSSAVAHGQNAHALILQHRASVAAEHRAAVLDHRAEIRARHHAAVLAHRHPGAGSASVAPSQKPRSVSQASKVPPAETDGMPGFSFPPSASGDTYMVAHDHPLTITAPGVLVNDTNPIGGTMTASVVAGAGPAHAASFNLNADGSFTYTPTSHFAGTDTFQYRATNSDGSSGPATVNIAVLDFAPTSADKLYIDTENQVLHLPAPGLRDGTSDPENDPTTLILVAGPSHGSLVADANGPAGLRQDGSFSYLPDSGFVGTDTFTYKANDGVKGGRIATVTISVSYPLIASVDWVAKASPLDGNPHPGLGLRIYPDKPTADPSDTTDYRSVKVIASLGSPYPGVPIYSLNKRGVGPAF